MGSNENFENLEDDEIVIDGEHFSLLDIPPAESRLVKAESLHVLKNIPLGELMARLQRTGDLIHLAAHSRPATDADIRARMGDIHERFALLCGRCSQEMGAMQDTTRTLLSGFNRVSRNLLGGQYCAALAFMGRACNGAKTLGVSLSALSAEFDGLADLSRQTLQASHKAQGREPGNAEEWEKNMADLHARIAMGEASSQQLEHSRKALQALFDEVHQRADQTGGRAFALSMVGAILAPMAQATGPVAGAYLTARNPTHRFVPPDLPQGGSDTSSLESAQGYRQEKHKYLDRLMARKDGQIEMSANLRRNAVALQNVGAREGMAEIAAHALLNGITALRQVAALLRDMAFFWSGMAAHYDRLAYSGVASDVGMAQDMPMALKHSICTDPLFKTEVVTSIAGWVALGCIATDGATASAEMGRKAMATRGNCLDDAGVLARAQSLGTQLLGDIDTDLKAARYDRQAIENEKAGTLGQVA